MDLPSPSGEGAGGGSWLFLPVRARPERRLRAVAQAKLAQDVRDVILHGAFRDEQRLANLAVALALREQAQNIALALGQVVQRHASTAASRLRGCWRGRGRGLPRAGDAGHQLRPDRWLQ